MVSEDEGEIFGPAVSRFAGVLGEYLACESPRKEYGN